MRKSLFSLVLLLGGTVIASAQPAEMDPNPAFPGRQKATVFNSVNPYIHDPVMAKEGDTYYVFGTGLQELSSKDLVNWKSETAPMVDFAWIKPYIPGFWRSGAWAPDILWYKGKWNLFYASSAGGRNTSVIGRLTRSTLDPSADEPWKDCGEIIHSAPGETDWNAIDANVVLDDKGTPWLTFGSFWDGIQFVRLKKDLSGVDGEVRTIARHYKQERPDPPTADPGTNTIEAPFIFKHGGYYYLFVSWDYCCRANNSTYRVVVGRSKNVEGPYRDREGRDMADGGGTLVAYNSDVYQASGHNSAFTIDGKDYYVTHAYERASGESKLVVTEMGWDDEDWPIVTINKPGRDVVSDRNTLTVDLRDPGAEVSPDMYGVFFEEINHSGTGSLYAELLQNRGFEEQVPPPGFRYGGDGRAYPPHRPNYYSGEYSDWTIEWHPDSLKFVGWKVEGDARYDVVDDKPLNDATPHSMRLDMAGKGTRLINTGYWGVRVSAGDNYHVRFFQLSDNYSGNITARIVGSDGTVFAQNTVKADRSGEWTEYKFDLRSSGTDTNATFELVFDKKGTVHVDWVSLFPEKTFMGRENGLRPDVAQAIADLEPGFVRWPGGCIVEGATQKNGFKWKNTIGDPVGRQSEWILWGYHTTWGFGYHEFLQFCEDLGASPMFVANVSLSCTGRNGDYVMDRDSLSYFIQDISDAIEYANGDVTTEWGARRAAAGHPEPFGLKYVEIGNEQIGPYYAEIYKRMYSVLKEKYPEITFINTLSFSDPENIRNSGRIDMIDPHWYVAPEFFFGRTDLFDHQKRGSYDVYVGEYAALMGVGRGNMTAALSEAAWLTGLERNSDLVKMSSYAPLIENTNRADWHVNLIWTNNTGTIGRSSYYVQQMFSRNRPDYNVATDLVRKADAPLSCGYVGFTGADLNAKVKNLKISEGGSVVYSDVLGKFAEDKPSGNARMRRFSAPDAKIVSPEAYSNETVEFQICPNPFRTVSDAKPLIERASGNPALVLASDRAGKNYQQLTFGGEGVNLMYVTGGIPVNQTRTTPYNFQKGRWYKVKVILTPGGNVSVFIDGHKVTDTRLMEYSTLHAVAGYDEKAGETIIKVVNGGAAANRISIALECDSVVPEGKVITLKAESGNDENSFDEPKKISPVETAYNGFSKNFEYEFAPYSLTVLRIKSK